MKLILPLLACVVLVGCASDPLMTGEPQDWQGKPSADLKAAMGQPTKSIAKADGTEVWDYVDRGEYAGNEEMSFRPGAFAGAPAAGSDDVASAKNGTARFEKIYRFYVKNGKVRSWYAARLENGKVVWDDH